MVSKRMTNKKRSMKGKSRRVKKSVRRSRRYRGGGFFGSKTEQVKATPKFATNDLVTVINDPKIPSEKVTAYPGKFIYRVTQRYYNETLNSYDYHVELHTGNEDYNSTELKKLNLDKIYNIFMLNSKTDPFSANIVSEDKLAKWSSANQNL